MKKYKLDIWLKITQMVSMLLIPLVIAFIGWRVQKSISDSNTQKDYIAIAVNILNDPMRVNEPDLKKWATNIIVKYSPIEFTPEAKSQLSPDMIHMLDNHPLLKSAFESRDACPTVSFIDKLSEAQQQEIITATKICQRNAQDLFWIKVWIGLIKKSD